MTTATAKKPKEPKPRLSLHESVELLRLLDQAVEDNIDEIELNGGALPDWMSAMFDEVGAAMADRADAIAAVVDEMKGNASSAKATKDRAARREKVWGNVVESIKRYVARELERNGDEPIKGTSTTLRFQRNSSPSTKLVMPEDVQPVFLLHAADEGTGPLARFITVQRIATLDTKALADAYEARAAVFSDEAAMLDARDLPQDVTPTNVAAAIAAMRADHVQRALASEFPGVSCVRGRHVRID